MITFQEFQAMRRAVPDLGVEVNDADVGGQPGVVYGDTGLFMYTRTPAWSGTAAGPYEYMLTIGNQCWTDNDPEPLERELFAWAVSEGYFDGEGV